ncbi:MAG: TetR/AcrR family transcriptional regulator [Chloroflexi bacterium]|nr:MAG: TetR/AcrR family transcriptional regulator [Chloroflexota bacterium]
MQRKSVKGGTQEPRTPLSRERVLRAAINLADRDGIDSLSMRKLGQQVGVEAMSLYNHVRNKEDVLNGMVDFVFSEIDLPSSGADWSTAMRQRAISARQALLRHPWAIGLMESRVQPGPATLRHHDSVLRNLREAGFSVELAAHAYSVLDSYIYGFTLNELTLPFDTSEGAAEVAGNIFREFLRGEYPYLAEMATEHAMKPGYNYGDEFEFGLDLILAGLDAAIKRSGRSNG